MKTTLFLFSRTIASYFYLCLNYINDIMTLNVIDYTVYIQYQPGEKIVNTFENYK